MANYHTKVAGNTDVTVYYSFFLLKSGRKEGLFNFKSSKRFCKCLKIKHFFCLVINIKRRKKKERLGDMIR